VLDDEARIISADIVPPTAQNQPQIEADLARVIRRSLHLDEDALRHRCEQTIRNYDPCISCATHFLNLTVDRV
jgi:coenzyme F420-reducing hydrogenase alpha subunit